jgi:fructose-bisphosphate aldolase class I
MRSILKLANQQGINDIVAQQSTIKKQVLSKKSMPIIESKIDISTPKKSTAETLLNAILLS